MASSDNDNGMPAVVIVEQHQHALEHIHHVLRKQKRIKAWAMVHFDAHPDMACSNTIPAKLCFAPRLGLARDGDKVKTLYDYLDETSSGIAEWILPLTLTAKLKRIDWIKPMFSHQLPMGETTFQVGVLNPNEKQPPIKSFLDLDDHAVVRVDLHHPYYLDDDHVLSSDPESSLRLQLAQTVHLHVKHVGDTTPAVKTPWMLDICLDYFVCRNPFLHDIEVLHPEFAQLLLSLSKECLAIAASPNQDYRRKRREFHEAVQALLGNNQEDQGKLLRQSLQTEKDARIDKVLSILSDDPNAEKLATMMLQALPHIAMPHESTLPTPAELEKRIDDAIKEIEKYDNNTQPFLITIARSTNDGFCPLALVETIQKRLLHRLEDVYCWNDDDDDVDDEASDDGFSNRNNLRVVKDYGEGEGSTLDD
jgi:hypothetical protein